MPTDHPFMKPTANPADILPVNGIPKFDVASAAAILTVREVGSDLSECGTNQDLDPIPIKGSYMLIL